MKKLVFLLLLVSGFFASSAYKQCPIGCECLSETEFFEEHHRSNTLDDFCNGREIECGYDLTHRMPKFCFKVEEEEEDEVVGSGYARTGLNSPGNHEWYYDSSSSDRWNEMLQLYITASPEEDIKLTRMTLQAFGTGNDSADITKTEVYFDLEGNGVVDHTDMLIGSAEPAYLQDDGEREIKISLKISADSTKRIIIAYVMSPNASMGKTYGFTVKKIEAKGETSDASFEIDGLPRNSSIKTVVATPPAQCSGNLTFRLNQSTAPPRTLVRGDIGGLQNCDNMTARIGSNSCGFTSLCTCAINNTGCSCSFNVPSINGTYNYCACADLNLNGSIDSNENACARLNVELNETIEVPECASDMQCAENEYCVDRNCTKIIWTCGYAANHSWVRYECGTESGCSNCTNGKCENHKCVPYKIESPDKSTLNQQVTAKILRGNSPGAAEHVVIRDPGGNEEDGTTDSSGEISFVPKFAGIYKISVVYGSNVVASKDIEVSQAKGPIEDIEKLIYLLFNEPIGKALLIVVAVIIIVGIYRRFDRRTVRPPEQPSGQT